MWQLPRPQVGWVTVLLLTCVWGCAATEKEKTRYETIEAELDADTDKAIALNKKALKFLDEADLERAEEHLQQSLVADVNYGPAHNNLGQVYFQQERYYLAAWEFEYAARLLPENPEPVNNLGLVYDTVGRLDNAIVQYELALTLDAENPETIANLARARVKRGDDDLEMTALLEEVRLRDERQEWWNWAGELLTTRYGRTSVVQTTSGESFELPVPSDPEPQRVEPIDSGPAWVTTPEPQPTQD